MDEQLVIPSLGFGLEYPSELIYCEVIPNEQAFEVLFNGKPVAEIQLNENMNWMLFSGIPLPNTIINEIGWRIENVFA